MEENKLFKNHNDRNLRLVNTNNLLVSSTHEYYKALYEYFIRTKKLKNTCSKIFQNIFLRVLLPTHPPTFLLLRLFNCHERLAEDNYSFIQTLDISANTLSSMFIDKKRSVS